MSEREEMALPYKDCLTCGSRWEWHPPTRIKGHDLVRCVECKAVYPLAATPAPGYAEGLEACREAIRKIGDAARAAVDHVGYAKAMSQREAIANAHLISAAPELLEALIEARSQLEAYESERTGEHYNNLQINAAIAKAEPRS